MKFKIKNKSWQTSLIIGIFGVVGLATISTLLAVIMIVFSLKALQQLELDSAGQHARTAGILLKPAQLLTLRQAAAVEATDHVLAMIELLPKLRQDLNKAATSFGPQEQAASESVISTSVNQLLSPTLLTNTASFDKHYQEFLVKLDQSWLLSHFISSKHKQKLTNGKTISHTLQTLINHFAQGEHQLVILLNNSDELRAGGGFIGSVAAASLTNGQLAEPVFYDIYDLNNQPEFTQPAPPGVAQYLSQGKGLTLTDANWQVDFSRAAQDILFFLNQTHLPDTDLIISINLDFIKSLLTLTDGVYLIESSAADKLVTADNLNQLARAERLNFFAGDKQKKQFLEQLYKVLKLELTQLEPTQQSQLALALAQALHSKNIIFYSVEAQVQQQLVKAHWAGAIFPKTPYFLYLPESNVGINKANQLIDRSVQLSIESDLITIKHQFNNLNQPLTEIEVSQIKDNPDLLQANHLGYVNYQRIVTNLPLQNIKLECNDSGVKLEENSQIELWQDWAQQLGFLITIPEESTQECVYLLEPKHSLSQQQAWTIIKQPGLPNTLYQINFFQTLSEHELTTDLIIGTNYQL